MEKYELPLSELTLSQKLHIMETLWENLAQSDEAQVSPPWHEEVLRQREEALAAGRSTFSDWEEAKERIRRNVSCG